MRQLSLLDRVIAIVLQKKVVILDAGSHAHKFSVKSEPSDGEVWTPVIMLSLVITDGYPLLSHPCNPIALGTRWLAFAETKVPTHFTTLLSCPHLSTFFLFSLPQTPAHS